MLPKYIVQWINNGEGANLDFKHSIADSYKIAKSLVSFANARGGTLLVGVDDKGRIVGVDENEERYMLEIAAKSYCKPPIELYFKEHKSQSNKLIIECTVNEGEDKPYLCKETNGAWKAYLRIKDECKLASAVSFEMMKIRGESRDIETFGNQEIRVLELLKLSPEGLPKNKIGKLLKIGFKEIISVLAKLMHNNVVIENISLNKTLYKIAE